MKINHNNNEFVIKQGAANHFVGIESVGGQLYLTNERLFYKSHNINFNNHELNIPLKNIKKTIYCRTFFVVPNGLKIHLKNGKIEQFVLWKKKQWKNEIDKLI